MEEDQVIVHPIKLSHKEDVFNHLLSFHKNPKILEKNNNKHKKFKKKNHFSNCLRNFLDFGFLIFHGEGIEFLIFFDGG